MNDMMLLYIGDDGRTLTDWEGKSVGRIELPITKRRHNGWISRERWWFRARIGGQTYACQGFGPEVYCKVPAGQGPLMSQGRQARRRQIESARPSCTVPYPED